LKNCFLLENLINYRKFAPQTKRIKWRLTYSLKSMKIFSKKTSSLKPCFRCLSPSPAILSQLFHSRGCSESIFLLVKADWDIFQWLKFFEALFPMSQFDIGYFLRAIKLLRNVLWSDFYKVKSMENCCKDLSFRRTGAIFFKLTGFIGLFVL